MYVIPCIVGLFNTEIKAIIQTCTTALVLHWALFAVRLPIDRSELGKTKLLSSQH